MHSDLRFSSSPCLCINLHCLRGSINSNLSMSGLECHLPSSYPSTAKQHPLNWASPQQRYLRSSMAPLSHSYLDPDPSAFYVQSPFGDTGNHFDMVSILWSDIIKMDSNLICPQIVYICMVRKFGSHALHVRHAPFILGLNMGKGEKEAGCALHVSNPLGHMYHYVTALCLYVCY